MRLDPRVLGERLAGVRHLQRLGEQRELAVVGGAQLLERRDDLEARAAGVERVVVRDLGPVVRERDPAVGQVETRRELGVALVGAVAEAEEAADALRRVVDVEVHRLVEVRRLLQRVHVLVLGFHPNRMHVLPARRCLTASPVDAGAACSHRMSQPEITEITSGLQFPEGPVAMPDGSVHRRRARRRLRHPRAARRDEDRGRRARRESRTAPRSARTARCTSATAAAGRSTTSSG